MSQSIIAIEKGNYDDAIKTLEEALSDGGEFANHNIVFMTHIVAVDREFFSHYLTVVVEPEKP